MNKYEELIEKADTCIYNAIVATDSDITTVFVHAAIAYRNKAESILIKEAVQCVN